MTRKVIETTAAPGAVGPYSQAIEAAGLVWASGQIALDPQSGRMIDGGVEPQTRQAMLNLAAVLEAAGSSLDRVIKATIYLVDMRDFAAVNEVYAGFFPARPPARVCVEVSRLPKDARVEIDAVALS